MNQAPDSTIETNNRPTAGTLVLAALLTLLALGATALLYHEALGLPFFFDDMIHMRWLDGQTLPSIWTLAEGLGYYRPLTMSVWKIDHLLFGQNDPVRLHALNLLLHALNGILAGALAWRAYYEPTKRDPEGADEASVGKPLGSGAAFSLIAALIFVAFPFSFQAVPSTSSLSKPLIATLVLGSILLYWEARLRRSRRLLALSLLLGFLAPFAYELGVMVPLAILATELLAFARKEFERFSWQPVLYMLLIWGVGLPLVILLEPEGGAPLRLPSLLALWQNGVYFGQGLAFPIAPIATLLERVLPLDHFALVAAVDLLGLILLLAVYRWAGRTRLFLYGLAWFLIGTLPLWLMLDFAYVITSPRILYLGAVGSALLWAGLPVLLWSAGRARWWTRALAVVSLLGMVLFSGVYVRDRMSLAQTVAAPLWQAIDAAQAEMESATQAGEIRARLLYLNVPAWMAPKEPVYRIGSEGLTFIPEYVRVQDFVYVNSGVEPRILAATHEATKKDWSAYIGYAHEGLDGDWLDKQVRRADGIYLMTYPSGSLSFVKAGSVEAGGTPPEETSTPLARFGEEFLLLDQQVTASGPELVLELWWACRQPPAEDVTVFVHTYDGNGQLIAQADGLPLQGLLPPQQCQPGDLAHDIRHLTLPEGAADAPYRLVTGWYKTAGGTRLPALDQDGQPAPDDAIELYQQLGNP